MNDFKVTVAPWRNKLKGAPGHEHYVKSWARKGKVTKYKAGTVTPHRKGSGIEREQPGAVCAPHTGLLVVECDYPEAFPEAISATLRPTVKSSRGYHYWIDARAFPAEEWPSNGPIPGGDVKAAGFVPLPGCDHWSGCQYEELSSELNEATPELMELLRRLRSNRRGLGGGGGSGGGSEGTGDGQEPDLFNLTGKLAQAGMPEDEAYAAWARAAAALPLKDVTWPWTREDDFSRHWKWWQDKLARDGGGITPGQSDWARNIGGGGGKDATPPVSPCHIALTRQNLREHCSRAATLSQITRKLKAERNDHPESRDWDTAPDGAEAVYQAIGAAIADRAVFADTFHVSADSFPDLTGQVRAWLTREAPLLDVDDDGQVHLLNDPKPPRHTVGNRGNYPGCPATADPLAGRTFGSRADSLVQAIIQAQRGRRLSARMIAAAANNAAFREAESLAGYRYMSVGVAGKARKRLILLNQIHVVKPAEYYRKQHMWHVIPASYTVGPDPGGAPFLTGRDLTLAAPEFERWVRNLLREKVLA